MDIRLARVDDAAAISRIYNHEVTTSTVTFDIEPRTVEEQQARLVNRAGAHAVLVAEIDGAGVGFASLSPYRDRPAYNTSVEDSVYVDPGQQGAGVGSRLLEALIEVARDHGFHAVLARIVGGHAASIRLHEKAGFTLVGTEHEVGRKFGRWLDVVVMQKLL